MERATGKERTGVGLAGAGIRLTAVYTIAALLGFLSGPANALIYTVGGDAACDFSDVAPAITAAHNHAGVDEVRIATNKTYSSEQITIAGQDVDIKGGYSTCTDSATTANDSTTINGASNGGPVFSITGSSHVNLDNLFITGAHRGSQASGGGISFTGTGSLTLQATSVTQNYAGYGAGIDMSPSSDGASLTLAHDTIINNNTAAISGGGIRIEGKTDFVMLADRTLIYLNHALGQGDNGYGGGIEIIGPAHAEIGSPGYGGIGAISSNDAQYGGGIAILATAGGSRNGYAWLFTTDAANPVRLEDNRASVKGGAAYLHPFTSSTGGTSDIALCAVDFRIDTNSAPDGAAVYLDWDTTAAGHDEGSKLMLGETDPLCPADVNALGAVRCQAGTACNEMSGNMTETTAGAGTSGAVVLVGTSSTFHANQLAMRSNTAGTLATAVGDDDYAAGVTFENCLLAENRMWNEVIRMNGDDAPLVIDNCTIAYNVVGIGGFGSDVLRSNDTVTLTNSIITQPNVPTLDYTIASGLVVDYVMSNDISTLTTSTSIGVVQGTPLYVDGSGNGGDYHLQPGSAGIDFAPGNAGTTSFDLDGNRRNVDLIAVPDVHGTIDLGAYELQRIFSCGAADTIFCSGFDSP